jgi:hypothetical protein
MTIENNPGNAVKSEKPQDTTPSVKRAIRIVSINRVTNSSREYQLQISIPAELFQDVVNASDKEVEFLLDLDKDDVRVRNIYRRWSL